MLYGKSQPVRYRSKILMARFLGSLLVRVVWSEMQSKTDQWKPARLLLCTDTSLTAEQVIESYGLRWSIESMFHELKEAWGLKSAWQQTLNRWVHLTMTGYGVMQLLSFIATPEVSDLCHHSPWRKGSPTTAGQIRKGLTVIFRNVCVRDWWNRKCRKFEPPNEEILASTA